MAYVQRFVPRGTDAETLNYFMKSLSSRVPDPENQQLVAQQAYDLARAKGVKEGNLTTRDLDFVFDQMSRGLYSPLPNPEEANPFDSGDASRLRTNAYSEGNLLPRSAVQSPLETMRTARYYHSGDAAADASGAFLYRMIDSATLGLIGAAGGLLKRAGAKENFWTESIGGAQSFLGMDFGEGGIKEGDTTAGEWASRGGELAGFILPAIATGGGSLLAKGAASGAAKASRLALAATEAAALEADVSVAARLTKAAGQLTKKSASLTARQKSIEAGTKAASKVIKNLPANKIFELAGGAIDKIIVGEARKGIQSRILANAAKATTGLDELVKPGHSAIISKILGEAGEEAGKAALAGGRHVAAKDLVGITEKAIYENPDVLNAARGTFQAKIMNSLKNSLGLDMSVEADVKYLKRIVENADDIFVDAFKGAREGGLLGLQEKMALKGKARMGLEFAKFGEEAAHHVTNMIAMGLVRRLADPIAEPEAFGMENESAGEFTKDVAKYWLRGAKVSPFEGVAGDVFAGLMFASGGTLKLIPAFQKVRTSHPKFVLSQMVGGSPGEWNHVMDGVDASLSKIYNELRKDGFTFGNRKAGMSAAQLAETQGEGALEKVKNFFKRNNIDFGAFSKRDRVGFAATAKDYLKFMEENKDLVPGPIPFSFNMIDDMLNSSDGLVREAAREEISRSMTKHFEAYMGRWTKDSGAKLLKDIAQFGMITTATSFASAPTLWLEYAKGDDNIHPADLVMHTIFSGMMARSPYYAEGASPYIRAVEGGTPMTSKMQEAHNFMRLKNALRHLGMRDPSLITEGVRQKTPYSASFAGPLKSDEYLNEAISSAKGWPDVEVVANESDITDRAKQVTVSEIGNFVRYLAKRVKQGLKLDEYLTPEQVDVVEKAIDSQATKDLQDGIRADAEAKAGEPVPPVEPAAVDPNVVIDPAATVPPVVEAPAAGEPTVEAPKVVTPAAEFTTETTVEKPKRPIVLEGVYGSDQMMQQRMANVLGAFKGILTRNGFHTSEMAFDGSAVERADAEFHAKMVGGITGWLSGPFAYGDDQTQPRGALQRIEEITQRDEKGRLKYVKITNIPKDADTQEVSPETARVVAGQENAINQLIDIMRDFRTTHVATDDLGERVYHEVDASELLALRKGRVEGAPKDALELLDSFVVDAQDSISRIAGLGEPINLTQGKRLHDYVIAALLEAKADHAVGLLEHNGTLYDRFGNHISKKSIVSFAIANNWVHEAKDPQGGTHYVTDIVNLKDYDPAKRKILMNFFNMLDLMKDVTVRWYEPGKTEGEGRIELTKAALDKFFEKNQKLRDARLGVEIEGRSMEDLMTDTGILLESDAWVRNLSWKVKMSRESRMTEEHRRFLDAVATANALRVDQYGGKTVDVMVIAENVDKRRSAAVGHVESIADLPDQYYKLAVGQGQRNLKLALNKENMEYVKRMVNELRDLGILTGFSAPMKDIGDGTMVRGRYSVYSGKDHETLRAFAAEINHLRTRTVGEALTDLDKNIAEVNGEATRMELRGETKLARYKNLKKLEETLRRIRNDGKYWFYTADKFMVKKGVISFGKDKKGKDLKYYISSDKKLASLVKELNEFYAIDQMRRIQANETEKIAIAQQAADELRKSWLAKQTPERPSFAHFAVDIGMDLSADTRQRIAGIFDDALDISEGKFWPDSPVPAPLPGQKIDIVDHIRTKIMVEVKKLYDDVDSDIIKKKLDEYSDDYLLSLVDDMYVDSVPVYDREPGSFFNSEPSSDPATAKLGQGKRRKGKKVLDIPRGGTIASTINTDYVGRSRSVRRSSADLSLREFTDISYIGRKGLDVDGYATEAERHAAMNGFRDLWFEDGLRARRLDANGHTSEESTGSLVLLRETSVGGDHIAFTVPTTQDGAKKFITGAERVLAEYEGRELPEELSSAVKELKFIVRELKASSGEDSPADAVRKFSIAGESSVDGTEYNTVVRGRGPRRIMWERTFELLRLHSYNGSHAIIDAYRAPSDANAFEKLIARSGLSAEHGVSNFHTTLYNETLRRYLASPSTMDNAGHRLTMDDLTSRHGVVLDANGEASGFRALVYDGKTASEELKRLMTEFDSGIAINRNLIETFYAAKGYSVTKPRVKSDGDSMPTDDPFAVANALAKIRIVDRGPDGLLLTKDVMAAEESLQRFMEEHNISMIISSDALKQVSGKWDAAAKAATIKAANGEADVIDSIIRGADTSGVSGEAMIIPLESMRWQHPIEANPLYAAKSGQLTNMRDGEYVAQMVAELDARGLEVQAQVHSLLGSINPKTQAMLHYVFSNDGRILNSEEIRQGITTSTGMYMKRGGPFASPMHYGGDSYHMNVLKNKLISDRLFKFRTDAGSQSVYTSDLRRVINSGEAVISHRASGYVSRMGSGYVGFRVYDADEAARMNRETFGYGEDADNFNKSANGATSEREPSDMAHVRLWNGGSKSGIAVGLMGLRHTESRGRGNKIKAKMRHANGNTTDLGAGANDTVRIIRGINGDKNAQGLAGIINDAWQFVMKNRGPENGTIADENKYFHDNIVDGADGMMKAIEKYDAANGTNIMEQLGTLGKNGARGEVIRVAADLLASRGSAMADLRGTSEWMWKGDGIQNFRAHNALSYLFGSYNYYDRNEGAREGLGLTTFGLTTMTQRHPSTMPNDTVPMAILDYLRPEDGNQFKSSWRDAEMIMKADQDEDHINYWFDYGNGDLGDSLAARGLSGGFTEPKIKHMERRDLLTQSSLKKSYVDEWVDRQNDAKMGIGLVSKAISAVSDALHKEIMFSWTEGQGAQQSHYLVAPIVAVRNGQLVQEFKDGSGKNISIMRRTLAQMGKSQAEITELLNLFLDAKSGAAVDPKAMNLQNEVAKKFFTVFQAEKDDKGNTYWREKSGGLSSHANAERAFESAIQPLYKISSMGKDVMGAETAKGRNFSELVRLAQRYDTIFGVGRDHQQTLRAYIIHSMSQGMDKLDKKTRKWLGDDMNVELHNLFDSLKIVGDKQSLAKRTVYDSISDTILKAEGAVMSGDRRPFLTSEEAATFNAGNKAMSMFDPSLRTASAAHYIAQIDNLGWSLQALDRRVKNGEVMLRDEAAAVRAMYTEGLRYWDKNYREKAWERKERVQPDTNEELYTAMNDTRDGYGIKAARAIGRAMFDTRPEEQIVRLDAAHEVRSEIDEFIFKKMQSQLHNDPRMVIGEAEAEAFTERAVYDYMRAWGKDGNEIAAALDLMDSMPYGYYVHKGAVMTRYKPFSQGVFSAILKTLVVPEGAIMATPEWKDSIGRDLMTVMARAAATADAVMSGDPNGLYNLNQMVELIENTGLSGTAAYQFKDLKSRGRQKKARENMVLANMNYLMNDYLASVPGSGFGDPTSTAFGFNTARDADNFFRNLTTEDPSIRQLKINSERTRAKSPFPTHMLDPDLNDRLISVSVFEKNGKTSEGLLERSIRRGFKQDAFEEDSADRRKTNKKGQRTKNEELMVEKNARRAEVAFLNKMLMSLDARWENRGKTSNVDVSGTRGNNLSEIRDRLRLEGCVN